MDLLAEFSGAWRYKEVKERGDKLKCSIAKVELMLERRIGTGMGETNKETGGGAGLRGAVAMNHPLGQIMEDLLDCWTSTGHTADTYKSEGKAVAYALAKFGNEISGEALVGGNTYFCRLIALGREIALVVPCQFKK